MARVEVTRAGAILAVENVERSLSFYGDLLGFAVDATYDDPPYATLSRAGMRLSLAEQGHPAEDRPGVLMVPPEDPARASVVLVLEVEDCSRTYDLLQEAGADFLAPPYSPPWGGQRFFVRDPDRQL